MRCAAARRPALSRFRTLRLVGSITRTRAADLTTLGDLMETGGVPTVIDRQSDLGETVDAAQVH